MFIQETNNPVLIRTIKMSAPQKIPYLNEYHYEVLYGALLHDIGKFFLRAYKARPSRYSSVSKEDIGSSGAHSRWSAEFFQTHLKGNLFEKVNEDIIEVIILYHHNPESNKIRLDAIEGSVLKKLVKIVQIADHASSGERIKREIDEGYGSPRTEVMRSVFSSVKLDKEFSGESFYSVRPLSTGARAREALFPKSSREEAYGRYASDTQPLYKQIYDQFTKELSDVLKNNKKITFTTLYNLIFKYTLNVPSATFVDIPDISLFDHLKTTASIAMCLYLDLMAESQNSLENLKESSILNHDRKRYLLVQGNISGIQNFIYSIASKGAAKGLKGRSYFVQYLGEIISRSVLEGLNLPSCCEIYCDGGNFYLVVPACQEGELKGLTLEIQDKLLTVFKGDVFVDINRQKFNRHNLSTEPEGNLPFNKLWSNLNSLVGKRKYQRYNDIVLKTNGYDELFSSQGVGGLENRVCSICKQEKEKLGDEQKCPLCKDFENLTRKLIGIKYILISTLKPVPSGIRPEIESIHDFSSVFQTQLNLIEDDDQLVRVIQQKERDQQLYKKIDLFLINDTNFSEMSRAIMPINFSNLEINLGFNFISNVVPLKDETVKDFDNIASDENTLGDTKIGILRMDVDNLGRIFSEGLKPSSLSRLTSLSLRIKLFFKYWMNEICKGNIKLEDLSDSNHIKKIENLRTRKESVLESFISRLKNNIYLIYSSGDDLFLMGHWNDIIILSGIIREIFTKYTSNNPNLTISAGLSITNPKFPLYQAAKLTGNAEEKAKSKVEKNSVCVLGDVFSWTDFKELEILKEKLYDYYKYRDLKKNFFHMLLQFSENYSEVYKKSLRDLKSTDRALVQNRNRINLYYNVGADDPEKIAHEAAYYSKWYWRFTYFLKRTKDRNKKLKDQLEELESIIVRERKIKDLFMPVRWAELLTKERKRI